MELADVTDSKSVGSDTVWVQVPLPAPRRSKLCIACSDFFNMSEQAHSADFAVSFKRIGYAETTVNLNREPQEQEDMNDEKA